MIEIKRGCGFRKIGGLYLEGRGLSAPCDRLPYQIKYCPVCGSGIKFTRGITWISWDKYAGEHKNCDCNRFCPICHPQPNIKYAVMWVGKSFYTPESFISEAKKYGISKRIAYPLKEKTWVLLAYSDTVHQNRIFYAFRPTKTVKIISETQASNLHYINSLIKKQITPLIGISDSKGNVRETFTFEEYQKNTKNILFKEE